MASYIALLRKDKNSDYGVEFPDLPGCISAGSTLEEARQMAEEALAAHAAFLREEGDDVPAPSTLDVIARQPEIKGAVPFMVELKEPSDKAIRINITVPERVLHLIDEAAAPMGGNRSAFMVGAAEEKARMLTQRNEKEFTAWAKTHLAQNKPLRVEMTGRAGFYKVTRTDGGSILPKRTAKKA
jgi:predicted RNase H-like HicB family nuclease